MLLVIGNKNYSSWSLRPWLLLRHLGIEFEERRLALNTPDFDQRIGQYSKARRVPVLVHDDLHVWDSLAICEYVAELYPHLGAWPDDRAMRARARSVSAEMHSGFAALRASMPMNCRRKVEGFVPSSEAEVDIDRVHTIWEECRARAPAGGPFLFGRFSIADAMFAPVASRFATYGVNASEEAAAYASALLDLPAMREWAQAGAQESEVIDSEEV